MTYSYSAFEGENAVQMGPFNLDFKSGEIVFITGGNGSGKTTLVKLITSLYQPNSGNLTLDGIAVDSSNLEWYRTHICPIFSERFNFDPITTGLLNQSNPASIDLIEKLHLKNVLKYNVSDINSTKLSSGQKARIALLPVFLSDEPIVILDEWAANQDPVFKDIFYRELLPELRRSGRMVIAVTHDNRYFDIANSVVTLDSGNLVKLVDQ